MRENATEHASVSAPMRAEALPGRILDVAIGRFASQGYAGTSVREIVEAAGCTKPALYYHFDSKQGLFRAAVAQARARLAHVETPLREGTSLADTLRQSFAALREHAQTRPEDLRFLFYAEREAALDPELLDMRPLRAEHLSMVEGLLRTGIASGEVRQDLPIEDAAIALVGMMHFELQLWLDGRDLADDFQDRMVSIYMRGVAR